jgi:hypothetical protein
VKTHFKILVATVLFLFATQLSANCFFEFDTNQIFLNSFEQEEACNKQFYFEQISSDMVISGTSDHVVLQKTVTVTEMSKLLIISDGRFDPINGPTGFVRIKINNDDQYSSYAIHDWSTGTTGLSGQHSFNVIAYREVPAGTYTVSLIASAHPTNTGDFRVGSLSSMSIMLDPSMKIVESSFRGETSDIDIPTYAPPAVDVNEGDPDRPFVEVLSNDITNTVSASSNVLSFVSGRAFLSCSGQGDALWGLWADNVCQDTNQASWGVNDLYSGAETQSNMYAHSIYSLSHLDSLNIKFGASELAFGTDQAGSPSGSHENDVCYKAADANLFTILNNSISGGIGGNTTSCSTYTFKCVGTTIGQAGCPNANADVTLASKVITIPANHSGVLFFSAKTRIQAGSAEDDDMVVTLGIKIDGVRVGSVGVQQLYTPEIGSSRSLSASYLSTSGTNSNVLSAGQHTIEAFINLNTTGAKFPSVPEELVLTYFDFD